MGPFSFVFVFVFCYCFSFIFLLFPPLLDSIFINIYYYMVFFLLYTDMEHPDGDRIRCTSYVYQVEDIHVPHVMLSINYVGMRHDKLRVSTS